ncbi:helix-turn-helix domain-containing protein [Saccharothrix sp. MB29]|nr:helix-turn-helix domain-containing protein [Saccharothrix sp. MB29]
MRVKRSRRAAEDMTVDGISAARAHAADRWRLVQPFGTDEPDHTPSTSAPAADAPATGTQATDAPAGSAPAGSAPGPDASVANAPGTSAPGSGTSGTGGSPAAPQADAHQAVAPRINTPQPAASRTGAFPPAAPTGVTPTGPAPIPAALPAAAQASPAPPPAAAGAVAEEFVRRIGRTDHGLWSVRAPADRIGVTPGHLTEVVKAATGRTPSQLVREARTREAQRLLARTDLSVRQVAGRVGFADPAYFCRFFRREAGTSPGEFRRSQ